MGETAYRLDGGLDARVTRRDASWSPRSPVDAGFEECVSARINADSKPLGANVVWVIDTSDSMAEEAALVQQNLNRFVEVIVASGLPDYRVVVVSKRAFVGVPEPLNSDAAHFLYVEESVDSPDPLVDLVGRYPDYAAFLLPDVTTHFIAETDDDSWGMTAKEFRTAMTGHLGTNFRVHAIASPPDPDSAPGNTVGVGCRGNKGTASHAGNVYWQLAQRTQGLTFSICTDDWGPLFTALAQATVETTPVPCLLTLPAAPPGTALDLTDIRVTYTPPNGEGEALTRVDDPEACNDTPSWFYAYDSADDWEPSTILLCQSACDLASSGGSLAVSLSCSSLPQ